ncbi:SLC13 family permease [Alkalitalea saponilacus]|uniref:Anion transporter n=1 Tax=Alkalitalea saponilacus TaxID=889453 RepID=A0A1T5HSQ1_9BACT|nr:SLC13 family permease [Alkalitalea saponilacus]SKC23729.1 anion transporter [Alkalitalea saponilacus]
MPGKSKQKSNQIKFLTGLILGIIGFCLPLFFTFNGLSYAGHIALGIFLMAAVFWMFETIPIYSTSMLVIFLQVVLLSQQGVVFSDASLPTTTAKQHTSDSWLVPAEAVDGEKIYVANDSRNYTAIDVKILNRADWVEIRSNELQSDAKIVSNANHKLVGYKPVSFSLFFGTLASPIIILFLGGFMLAGAAVKYNLDKNLTSVLLKPFGTKPNFIILGLMVVTATLSAFMSNTATTAMMMTVAIPIVAQVAREDKFRIILALCIPIAANIGGMATPIGTPPNAIAIANLGQQGINIEFGTWVVMMLPLVILLLLLAWFTMRFLFPTNLREFKLSLKVDFNKSRPAIILYLLFAATVLLWFTESAHGIPSSMVAFLPIAGLTVTGVMKQEDIRSLPWEVLWLVAGGIALGISMENTGLAMWLVASISWDALPQVVLIGVFGLVALNLSNFLSNTVTATLLIPLAVSMGTSGIAGEGFSLVISSLAIAAACNMAMLLPISTPPNAIAMSTGFIKTPDMVKVGIVIGLIGIVATLALSQLYWPFIIN